VKFPRALGPTLAIFAMSFAGLGVAHAAVGVPVTYEGHSYSTSVVRPSADKPQSKLWFAGNTWWGLLVSAADSRVHIHELMPNHTWRDTGVVVDNRLNSTGDALWDEASRTLVVAARHAQTPMKVNKLAFDPANRAWSQVSGFPVTVPTLGGSESATIDKDSVGRLWVTWTRKSRVWVAHSDATHLNWTAGFQPKVPDVVIKADDVSALIAFNGQIGVLWSDQQSHAFRFAVHRDGDPDDVWRVETAMGGANLADDHINLKQLSGDASGRLFAAIKTSQDDAGPNAMLVGVLVRTPRSDGTGSWSVVPAGTVADDHTRPLLMIDQTNSELYFFATAPVQGGDIFYKKTALTNPHFAAGRGDRFIDYSRLVNNASGAKHTVTAKTGLVLIAVAEGVKRYVHAEMPLPGTPADGEV
jgi:hypothetical protein